MYQVVLCTCPTMTSAKEIATHLVQHKLAACINIIPNVMSIYRWQNVIEHSEEIQLLIKTESVKFDIVSREIKRLHPYDTPEVVALNIQQGDTHYLNWIKESLN
ncbi:MULTISPECIES: divalent-cation tolerance protein CutA [Thalassotalea]|uniref:Divalent-cation tolerance protein CutA n=1 Tax=Thalassotalea castellviae TaxID=3075612 RepID=A0ABU3A488_9GAMM|nr:divalent-cation tolerance protein CutA [Thalassotalea sp. W431]MDT0604989.1 divalent-cation tolerance protein CutA [Thalassotalea sp. W431]